MCFATPQLFIKPSFWDLNTHGNHKTSMPTNQVTVAFDTQTLCLVTIRFEDFSFVLKPLSNHIEHLFSYHFARSAGFPIKLKDVTLILAILHVVSVQR
jgi:hypothetical protein